MKPIPSHELVGARVVGELPSADRVDLWVRISSGIVKYGVVIEYRDLDAGALTAPVMPSEWVGKAHGP